MNKTIWDALYLDWMFLHLLYDDLMFLKQDFSGCMLSYLQLNTSTMLEMIPLLFYCLSEISLLIWKKYQNGSFFAFLLFHYGKSFFDKLFRHYL